MLTDPRKTPSTLVPIEPIPPVELTPSVSAGQLVAVKPPPAARDLFVAMERLDHGMRAAARGRGSFPLYTLLDRVDHNDLAVGGSVTALCAVAAAVATPHDPMVGFLCGATLAGLSSAAMFVVLGWLNRKLHARPVAARHAKPFLDSFERGDATTQKMVVTRAARWETELSAHQVAGQELRQQLLELGRVRVSCAPTAERRLADIDTLVRLVPRDASAHIDGQLLVRTINALPAEDREQVAALLLERLFDGEKLRVGVMTSRNEGEVYRALVAAQPSRIATTAVLQQKVASA